LLWEVMLVGEVGHDVIDICLEKDLALPDDTEIF
jgi:hypothetical protein